MAPDGHRDKGQLGDLYTKRLDQGVPCLWSGVSMVSVFLLVLKDWSSAGFEITGVSWGQDSKELNGTLSGKVGFRTSRGIPSPPYSPTTFPHQADTLRGRRR